MKNKKNVVTSGRDKANAAGNSDDDSRLEWEIVFEHLKEVGSIDPYEAERRYGIRELRTIIAKLRLLFPIQSEWISLPHPQNGKLTRVKRHWLESDVIEALDSDEQAEELAKQQESAKIAKKIAKFTKTLEEMCPHFKRETIDCKLDEIYGKQAANDD